jgi:hypothetical protein
MARTAFWISSVLILTFAVLAGPAAACTEKENQEGRENIRRCLASDVSCRERCELTNDRRKPGNRAQDCVNGCISTYNGCVFSTRCP